MIKLKCKVLAWLWQGFVFNFFLFISSPGKKNFNSARRHSMVNLDVKALDTNISALYKPKNYYRLDVKELVKVSCDKNAWNKFCIFDAILLSSIFKNYKYVAQK